MDFKSQEVKGHKYTVQLAPDDCTGCTLCVEICPAESKTQKGHKALDMVAAQPVKERERPNYDFFLELPDADRTKLKLDLKGSQFLQPLFEYSGACSGCGETPYLKLLTQLYGDRALIANATGCSSIYGANLPSTPYCVNADGRGPAWSNSLFEDNAEFGFGMRLAVDKHTEQAREILTRLGDAGRRPARAGHPRGRPVDRGRPGGAAPAGEAAPAEARRAEDARGGVARQARRLPGEEVASGSSAATAGPTTSATAASITSSPRDGT